VICNLLFVDSAGGELVQNFQFQAVEFVNCGQNLGPSIIHPSALKL